VTAMLSWPSVNAPVSSAYRLPDRRAKGVEAFGPVTPQQLAENPDKILRTWQYAGHAERRDLGEPDQRGEMTAARPSPVRTAEPRMPGLRGHADGRRCGLRALRAQ
jgi:hypothetical protein